jgi:hypothetical protein
MHKVVKVGQWQMLPAPMKSDLDWKNLAYDGKHRATRKCTIGVFLLLMSVIMAMPIQILE